MEIFQKITVFTVLSTFAILSVAAQLAVVFFAVLFVSGFRLSDFGVFCHV